MSGSPTVPGGASSPHQLGPFLIVDLLGEGGAGVVYGARWGHREIALKVLHPSLVATDGERSRFFAEARLLAEIEHPSVVKVLNVGALDDGRPYLAMEKLEGETLAARLTRGPVALPAALGIFEQVASALETLHGGGLIHRDLKPENVMLVGEGSYAVLLDFGIAKPLDAPASTITQDGGVRGTPAYMAPERFFGQPASVATDVYEVGVLLYAMIVGRLPWGNSADPDARLNPARPSELGAALPPGLESEILRALSTRAQARPSSMAEFAAAVTAAAGHAGYASQRRTADLPAPARRTADLPVARDRTAPAERSASPRSGGAAARDARGEPGEGGRATSGRSWGALAVAVGIVAAALIAVFAFLSGGEGEASLAAADDADTGTAEANREIVESLVPERMPIDRSMPAVPDAARFHPASSGFLAQVDLATLRESALGPLLEALRDQPDMAPLIAIADVCSIDPIADLHWLSLGFDGPGSDDFDLVLSGSWDRARIEGCLERGAGMMGAGGTIERDGRLTRLSGPDGDRWIGWIDDRTFLFSTRAGADDAWIEARLEGDTSAVEGELAAMLEEVDRGATLWFAGDPGDAVGESFGDPDTPEPAAVFGAVVVTEGMDIDVGLRYPSRARAARAATSIEKDLDETLSDPQVKAFIGDVDLRLDGVDVRISARLGSFVTGLIGTAAAQELEASSGL